MTTFTPISGTYHLGTAMKTGLMKSGTLYPSTSHFHLVLHRHPFHTPERQREENDDNAINTIGSNHPISSYYTYF